MDFDSRGLDGKQAFQMTADSYLIVNGPHAGYIVSRTQMISNGTIQPVANWKDGRYEFHKYELQPHPQHGRALFHQPGKTEVRNIDAE